MTERAEAMPPLLIEVSPGELLDRLTILRIKAARVADPLKVGYVTRELESLERLHQQSLALNRTLDEFTLELSRVNGELWDIEDSLREYEARRDFSSRFIELARSVYRLNDRRARLKQQVNEVLKSPAREEKCYKTVL